MGENRVAFSAWEFIDDEAKSVLDFFANAVFPTGLGSIFLFVHSIKLIGWVA
jgi:hypothetical protein